MKRLPVVTLCGSKKFIDEFKIVERTLTLDGYVVLSPAIFNHPERLTMTKDYINTYHIIHDQKVLMSDIVIIISINGYIGEDTKREIEFAKANNKNVIYLNNIDDILILKNTSKFYLDLKEISVNIMKEEM